MYKETLLLPLVDFGFFSQTNFVFQLPNGTILSFFVGEGSSRPPISLSRLSLASHSYKENVDPVWHELHSAALSLSSNTSGVRIRNRDK